MSIRTFVRSLRRPSAALIGAAVLSSGVACLDSTATIPPSGRILFLNAAPLYNSTQLWVDSITVLPNPVSYAIAQYSQYIRASDTPRRLAVRNGTDTTILASTPLAIHSDSLYIAIFTQHPVGGGLLLIPDTAQVTQLGKTIMRVTNVAPSAGLVDVYVTAPDVDLATVLPSASSIQYERGTDFISFDSTSDSLRVRITPAGAKTPVLLNLMVDAPNGEVNEVFVLDAVGGGAPLKSFVLTKNSFF